MSTRALAIAVGVMLALGLAVWLLAPARSGSAAGPAQGEGVEPLLAFTPSAVREIIVERPGAEPERIERADAGWRLVMDSPRKDSSEDGSKRGAKRAGSWPMDGVQIRGLLSVLRALRPAADAPGATMPTDALTLRLVLDDGAARTLTMDPAAVGGRRLARADAGPVVYLDQPIYEALTSPGPLGWRDTRVFINIGAGTARVRIEHADAPIALARVRDRWFLRQPVRAPADPAAMDSLLDALANLRVRRWLDEPVDEDAAGAPGALRITVQRDQRTYGAQGGVQNKVIEKSFAALGAVDLAGATRFARVGDVGAPAIVDAGALAKLTPRPESLISKTALDAPSSRIAAIEITTPAQGGATQTLRRALDGWRVGDSSQIADSLAKEVLTLLTSRRADEALLSAPADATPIATVTLLGFDDGPIGAVAVARSPAGVVVTTGAVTRVYKGVDLPRALAAPG